jgi:transcriptional regulator of arginine metabolism
MKAERQKLILEIIMEQRVETQEDLLQALRARGCKATQATISRDIRELRLVKEMSSDGSYHYAESAHKVEGDLTARLRKIFRQSVTSCDVAQNLIVIKTMPGLASGACATLDGMEIPDLVGTLAGDDTALLIMHSNGAAEQFYRDIQQMLL